MLSEKARIGKRVSGDRHGPELRGTVGSVLRCYGEPECLALEVIQTNGPPRLFWHRALEEVEDGPR